jgi:GH24 family phage-related lysozyme (muramidase)
MICSSVGCDFIAGFEAMGFICPDGVIRAYDLKMCSCGGGKNNLCKKGVPEWTVGIGEHSGKTADSTFASEDEAKASFINNCLTVYTKRVTSSLNKNGVSRQLSQNEFDALVDLAYQHGNCNGIAKIIANGQTPTQYDWESQTGSSDISRRDRDYALFSGQSVTIRGYSKYFGKDNNNQGYCGNLAKVVKSSDSYATNQGGYGNDVASGLGTTTNNTSVASNQQTQSNNAPVQPTTNANELTYDQVMQALATGNLLNSVPPASNPKTSNTSKETTVDPEIKGVSKPTLTLDKTPIDTVQSITNTN